MKKLIPLLISILLFAYFLPHVVGDVVSWEIQIVDSNGDVGKFGSLALDSDSNPAISYYDFTNGDIKYARLTGTSWNIEVVDSVNVGLGFTENPTSLAFDPSGNPAITYYDHANQVLKYAHRSGIIWNVEVVDNVGSSGGFYSASISLAFDQSENPSIAYYNGDPFRDLKYANFDGTQWNTETAFDDGLGSGWTRSASLAFDSEDDPAITFRDPTRGMRYAHLTSVGWVVELVESGYGTGAHTSLLFDSSGNPAVAYHSQGVFQGPTSIKYARFDGASWNLETVDNDGGIWPSLAHDPSGDPAISYYFPSSGDLRYASRNGATWDIETVDSPGNVGEFTSLALDGFGNPNISYYDVTNGDLRFARRLLIVDIDIKPGSDPNCFNNNGRGVIPVAILGAADFDANQIDPSSVELEGLAIKALGKSNKLLAQIEDVNDDGFDDLVIQIKDLDGVFSVGDTTATLTGNLLPEFGSTPFQGTDSICIVQ